MLAVLADSVFGVTAASIDVSVITISFSMNLIRNIHKGAKGIYVKSRIRHLGHITMVVETGMYDEYDSLMSMVITIMFIADKFEEIPEKW